METAITLTAKDVRNLLARLHALNELAAKLAAAIGPDGAVQATPRRRPGRPRGTGRRPGRPRKPEAEVETVAEAGA